MNPDQITAVDDGRPLVFRDATVLTMDSAGVREHTDVLVIGSRIEAIGPALEVPDGTVEVDAAGGILMPGMIDTHRHMWQTALRGLGADWTLTQYFVFYYLSWGKIFRPQDIAAGNRLSGIEAVDAGVTTSVDWSHGLQTIEHGEAAFDALAASPGRSVLAYGNLLGAPWEWTNAPDFRAFARARIDGANDLLGFQLAFDVTGDPAFPEKAAFEAARELGLRVTTHAGVWGATNDDSIRLMYENGFMTPGVTYVHASTLSQDSYQRIAATGGTASVSTESEQSAGQGYPSTWALRKHGIPISLSMDTSVWWSADLFSAMRATLSADRSREHLEAHARGETVTHNALRAQDVVEYATIGGARALGLDDRIGSITVGKQADLVLIKNDDDPAMFPVLNPYGSVVYQAGRGDVDTVLVNGKVVKSGRKLVGNHLAAARTAVAETVEYARSTMGEDTWAESMTPEVPDTERIPNPYTYTDFDGSADRHNAEIKDLHRAGADIVQIDEPYMQARPEAARAYGLAALNAALDGVTGTTAVHICFGYAAIIHARPEGYSFLPELAGCSADQISIETAQSGLDLGVLADLADLADKTIILGVIDLSDPAVETAEKVAGPVRRAFAHTTPDKIVIGTDCGMKYLPRDSAFGKMQAMAAGAKLLRAEL